MLTGEVAENPAYISFRAGGAVWQTRLRVSHRRREAGKWVEAGFLIDLKVFNRSNSHRQLADFCRDSFSVGDFVFLSGKISFEEWRDIRSGEARSRYLVDADDIEIVNPSSMEVRDACTISQD